MIQIGRRQPLEYTEPKKRKRRPTPPLTESWLVSEAVRHLERWPASEVRVRRLLWQRVRRAQSFHGGTKEEAAPLVETVIARLIANKILDDEGFAKLWVNHLRRRGTSARMIEKKLSEKGVARSTIARAVAAYATDDGTDSERASAEAYARRRRLGPFRRPPDPDPARKRKDLAAMARAGFSYGTASDVLRGSSD
jgi:regulatory protein